MKRKYGVVAGCLCLAIAAGAAAAFFSGQPGTQSQGLSRGIVAWLFGLFGQEPTPETLGVVNYFLRRGAHLFLYFCMGLGLCGALQWQRKVQAWLPAMALGVVFAATDEYHQLFSGGRTGKPTDVLLDACGLAIGCGASFLVRRFYNRRHNSCFFCFDFVEVCLLARIFSDKGKG